MRISLSRLIAIALVLGPATHAAATQEMAETEQAEPAVEQRIAIAALVRDLVAHAREQQDPVGLIVAARILQKADIVLAAADGAPLILGRIATEEFPIVDAVSLLAEANGMAGDDPYLLEQIAEMMAAQGKGFLPQAIVYTHDLKGSSRLVMRARAEGGRPALVRVRGDGDARIEILVRDQAGREVCRDRPEGGARAGDLVCRWTPATTADYRVELINRSRVWTRTILVSN